MLESGEIRREIMKADVQERARLLDEIERLQSELNTAQSAAVNAISESARLRAENERLTRERDAARIDRDELRKVRDSWVAEAERLQEIVGRLPKDAAGNPICLGDVGFAVRRPVFGGASHVTEFRVDAIERDCLRNWQVGIAKPSEFHRTREAAEKARAS